MYNYYWTDFKKQRKKRHPLCTLKEFSRISETPYTTIRNRMKSSDNFPDVQMIGAKRNNYYKISDLVKWHEKA